MKKIKKLKKQYYIACEGYQEELYFLHLKKLINQEEKSRYEVNFKISNQKGGSPLAVVKEADRLISFASKKANTISAVFDYDFKEKEFIEAIHYCDK